VPLLLRRPVVTIMTQDVAGGLPTVIINFTKNEASSQLAVWCSCTAIKVTAVGLIALNGGIDGLGQFNGMAVYSNAFGPNEHRTLPTYMKFINGLAAGNHQWQIAVANAGTQSDGNDRYETIILELPA
jgi:hypothetical protein